MASSLAIGLSVSFSKIKFMMVGAAVAAEEKCSLVVADDTIDWIDHFPYHRFLELVRRLKEE